MIPPFFFRNIKIKLNSRTIMALKSSVVIFQAIKPLKPQWLLQPQQLHGLNNLYSIISSKKILLLMVGYPLQPNDQYWSFFCGMDYQKPYFSLKTVTFLLEAVEVNRCYFWDHTFKTSANFSQCLTPTSLPSAVF